MNNREQTLRGPKRECQEGRPEAAGMTALAPFLQFSEECLPVLLSWVCMSLDLANALLSSGRVWWLWSGDVSQLQGPNLWDALCSSHVSLSASTEN